MKKIILVMALTICCNNINAQDLINVPEVWEIDGWDGSNWNLLSKTTYTFNSNCLPTQALSEFINTSTNMLENAALLSITYNSSDLPIENINQIWNASTAQWENNLKAEFIYNGTNLIETINYSWVNSNWLFTDRILLTYTENLITTVTHQDWDTTTTTWINNSKEEHAYNPDNTLSTTIASNWDETIPDWVNNHRVIYTYSAGLLTTKETDNWASNNWVNNDIETFTYDGNDFLIETLEQEWNGSSYDNDSRVLRTNNADGNPTEMITQTWLFGSWLYTSRDRRTYPDCSVLSISKNKELDFKMYPNPASDTITIEFNNGFYRNILITDLSGKIIHTQKTNTVHNTINVTEFAAGLYFLSIKNDKTRVVKKIVKL